MIDARSKGLLLKCADLLRDVRRKGLFQAIEEGVFAGVKRTRSGGKGREGVIRKSEWYQNPIEELIRQELSVEPGKEDSNS